MKDVKISDHTHRDLKRLAKQNGDSMKDFIRHMVVYFKRSGEDPKQVTGEGKSPTEQIKNHDQRVISFIREQDKYINRNRSEIRKLRQSIETLAEQEQEEETDIWEAMRQLSKQQKKLYDKFEQLLNPEEAG